MASCLISGPGLRAQTTTGGEGCCVARDVLMLSVICGEVDEWRELGGRMR